MSQDSCLQYLVEFIICNFLFVLNNEGSIRIILQTKISMLVILIILWGVQAGQLKKTAKITNGKSSSPNSISHM